MYVYYNGNIIDEKQLSIPADSPAMAYGYGVFETIKVSDGIILFFDEHIERMKTSCKQLSIEFRFDLQTILSSANDLLKANCLSNGSIRIDCLKMNEGSSIIIRSRNNVYPLSKYIEGYRLNTTVLRKNAFSPIAKIKSLNYLDSIIAKNQAIEAGFDEALFLNNQEVICEGSMSNIFWVSNNKLYTPSIDCGVLKGITRQQVLKLARDIGLITEEGYFSLAELYSATEVFVTNSLMGIMPVQRVDSVKYYMADKRITSKLMSMYNELLKLNSRYRETTS